MKEQLTDFLVRKNGGSGLERSQLSNSASHLGLKLPVNPKKIKIGPKGEVLVRKLEEETWDGEFGGFYQYGGLYGARAKPDNSQV